MNSLAGLRYETNQQSHSTSIRQLRLIYCFIGGSLKHIFPWLSALISLTSDRHTPSLYAHINLCLSTHMHRNTHTHTHIHTHMWTFVYVHFFCNSLSLTHTHTPCKWPYRQTLMCPQTPLIKTNSSHSPHPPKPTLSYPSFIPASPLPSSSLHPLPFGPLWPVGRTGSHCNWFRHNLLPTW